MTRMSALLRLAALAGGVVAFSVWVAGLRWTLAIAGFYGVVAVLLLVLRIGQARIAALPDVRRFRFERWCTRVAYPLGACAAIPCVFAFLLTMDLSAGKCAVYGGFWNIYVLTLLPTFAGWCVGFCSENLRWKERLEAWGVHEPPQEEWWADLMEFSHWVRKRKQNRTQDRGE